MPTYQFSAVHDALKYAVFKNLWNKGLEEIIGPHGPFFSASPDASAWAMDPRPDPWRIAVWQLVEAAQAKDLAAHMKDGPLRRTAEQRAQAAIIMVLDDWCGTPPRKYPWPWPGPPPWASEIASALVMVANSLQAGSLREGLMDIASQVFQRTNEQTSG